MKRLIPLVGLLLLAVPTAAAAPRAHARAAADPSVTAVQHHTGSNETITLSGASLDTVGITRCAYTVTSGATPFTNNVDVTAGAFTVTTKKFQPTAPYGVNVACTDASGSAVGSFAGTLTPIASGDGAPVPLAFTAAGPDAPIVGAPVDGAVYPLDKDVAARYRCPGAPSCVGTVPNGSPIDTSTVGPHTFTVTATTGAGRTAVTTVHYRVNYTWNGFFRPITNTDSGDLNRVDPGDLIKVGFGLNGDRGLDIFGAGSPASHAIPCPQGAQSHEVPAAGAGAVPGLQFGVASGHYTYGLQTLASWAGTCRRFELTLKDGTTHTADFVFPSTQPPLDLETLTVAQADSMMAAGTLTSVRLTQSFLNRIAALNTAGPGLNAVRSLSPDAIAEAEAADARYAAGHPLGAMDGIPALLKDNIDVAGMPTTAGAVALQNSVPPMDSTVAANLKAAGAVILGKTNLSEFANFITNSNPSGYSGLGGQVIAAVDADLNPSGSSSGSGSAAAAALALVTIGSETSGSIISPSLTEGIVGLRPTVGLVSRYGVVPISASQDTTGPMTKTVADAAALLQAIAGPDPLDHSPTLWGPGVDDSLIVPPQPTPVPNYLAALDPNALNGKRIGIVNSTDANYLAAVATVQGLGATTVTIPTPSSNAGGNATNLLEYEFKRDLGNYLQHLGPTAPMHSLADVIAFNDPNPVPDPLHPIQLEAIKFGHTLLTGSQAFNNDPSSTDSATYRTNLVAGKNGNRSAIDNALTTNNIEAILTPAGTLIGTGARAGWPQITEPAGYSTTTRRPVNISWTGTKYSEAKLLGFAYAYEQASHLRQPASVISPTQYRCADTAPPSPFAARGGCAPGKDLLAAIGGTAVHLPFSLETTSAQQLQSMLQGGTLTSVDLTKAYLTRIAETNVNGAAVNAVRSVDAAGALAAAAASDARRAGGTTLGPLDGLPVLVSDDVDVAGLPTTAGSVALQHSLPAGDSKAVANLKAAGAVVLGKTNTTELSGWMSTNMPGGYSSLGGQVLDPSDSDITPSGSSSGSAVAASAGLAALTIGTQASQVNGSLESVVSPAQANAVVALKPTVGLVSRTGVLPVSLTQETPGALGQTVYAVAAALAGMAGPDASDPATAGQPSPLPDYLAGLTPTALQGKRIAVVNSTNVNFQLALAAVQAAGATTVVKTLPNPSPNPADIVGRELKRDMNAYLGALPAGDPIHSLQGIVDYDTANAQEALKYGMNTLTTSNAVDLTNPATMAAYVSDRDTGIASHRAVIDTILNNGTPTDPADDFDAILAPSGSAIIGNADRAGYPVMSLPAGYVGPPPLGNTPRTPNNAVTQNPVNVTLVGTAYSEPRLLADAYAYEQQSHLRLAPSYTNPMMWRCVPGSLFPPRSCAP